MKEPVVENAKAEKGNIVMEEFVKQPPTEKGGLLYKLRELKKKISGHLSCMS